MYTVKILNSEEFDKLPFSRAKEALGAANPKTNIAYVRDTGYGDITKHTIEHELDELMSKTSEHEIDGIRYKIAGDIFSAVGRGIGNVGSAVGSGIGKAAGALGRGASAIGGGIKNVFSGGGADGQGSFGRIGDILGGSRGTSIPTPGGASTATFPGVGQGPIPRAGTGAGSASTIGGGGIFDFFKNAGSQILQGGGLGNFSGGPTGTTPGFPGGSTAPFPGPQQGGGDGSFLDNIFQSIGKAGVPALTGLVGDLVAGKPDDLDFSSVTGGLRDRISGDALSPLFEAGQRELLQDLSDPTEAPPEEAFARGDSIIAEDLEDQIENLRNQFKQLNPNANVENNSAFLAEKSRLEERARERRAQSRDEQSFGFVREQLQRDLQEIQTALGVDANQTEQLIRIAQLDVAEIVNQYGLELQEAAEIKELFGNFGQFIVEGGA